MTMMNQTYDEWKSTEPDDPYADELELERREQEMEPDEPGLHATIFDAIREGVEALTAIRDYESIPDEESD